MQQTKYVMYLRKSSADEGQQRLSIPAQERELRQLVQRRGLRVVGEPIRESMSARKPGRPGFAGMMQALRDREADAILCWHLNRLARNPVDGGAIMWALSEGTIKEILTLERAFTATPDDKLMMSIVFGMATKDVDDLSRNVRRGNREALMEGYWPGKPKLGYVRDHDTNRLIADPERWDYVREMFRLRLVGTPMREILRKAREEWGLTTRRAGKSGGKLISHSALHAILADPFYAGLMVRAEGSFQGSHPPAVTWSEFERVQAQTRSLKTNTPRPKRLPFAYRGLIRCGACGAIVTAEFTTNRYGKRYTYYHCCRKNRRYLFCPEPSIEVLDLEAQIEAFLASVRLPDGLFEVLLAELDAFIAENVRTKQKAGQNLADLIRRNEQRLDRLRELCVDGVISPGELARDRDRLAEEQVRLRAELERTAGPGALLEPLREQISFANLALSEFQAGDEARRRQVVEALASNLLLKDRTLLIEAKRPIAACAQLAANPDLLARPDDVGTFLRTLTEA
jgi:DNA invertase Pin-like site-specific DNA recombinase